MSRLAVSLSRSGCCAPGCADGSVMAESCPSREKPRVRPSPYSVTRGTPAGGTRSQEYNQIDGCCKQLSRELNGKGNVRCHFGRGGTVMDYPVCHLGPPDYAGHFHGISHLLAVAVGRMISPARRRACARSFAEIPQARPRPERPSSPCSRPAGPWYRSAAATGLSGRCGRRWCACGPDGAVASGCEWQWAHRSLTPNPAPDGQ